MDFMSCSEKPGDGDNPVVVVAREVIRNVVTKNPVASPYYHSRLVWFVRRLIMRKYDCFIASEKYLRQCANSLVKPLNALVKAAGNLFLQRHRTDARFAAQSLGWQVEASIHVALEQNPQFTEQIRTAIGAFEKEVGDYMRGVTPFEISAHKHLWFLRQLLQRLFWVKVKDILCVNLKSRESIQQNKDWVYGVICGEQCNRTEQYQNALSSSDACVCAIVLPQRSELYEFLSPNHGFSDERNLCEWVGLHVGYPVIAYHYTRCDEIMLAWISHSGDGVGPFPEDRLDSLVKALTPHLLRGEDPCAFSDFAELSPLEKCHALEIFVMRTEQCPYGIIHLANAYRAAGHEDLRVVVIREAMANLGWSDVNRDILDATFPDFIPASEPW